MERRQEPRMRLKALICRRTGEIVDLAEHERCPYCFGRMEDVRTGRHEAFCDYRFEEDPVHFGFRRDSGRHVSG